MQENKNFYKNFYWLAGLMFIMSLITMSVVYAVLWQTAINQKKADLIHIAQSQARLIEAIARFDMRHNRIDWETPIGERGPTSLLSERAGADTFSQIMDAHRHYKGFGQTGEIVIAGIEDSKILFLLRHSNQVFSEQKSVPLAGTLAEPMRRALSNLSGTMIGSDYDGTTVLAAYEPVDVLNLGIVAKIDYAEVKAPFIKSGLITLAITLFIILLGSILFRRLVNPIVQQFFDNEQKFKRLVENITEWIWEIDLAGVITYSSPQAEKMLGYNIQTLHNSDLHQLLRTEDITKIQSAFNRCIAKQAPLRSLECTFVHRDGHLVFLELNADIILDTDGTLMGFRGVAHDISERVAKERELRQYQENLELRVNERTEELEQLNTEMRHFAYIISHDLRSPLVSITGFIDELKDDITLITDCATQQEILTSTDSCMSEVQDALTVRIPESIYYINSATKKMNHLIQAILTISRVGRREFHFENVNLNQVVQHTLESLAYQIEQDKVSIEVAKLPTIMTDKLAMEQIIGNLLDNALKYLAPERPGLISISAETTAQKTIIHIQDNGRGISAKDLPHIFELFKRVGKQDIAGDGMGLTYVQTLVRRLGGKITCTSTLYQGSRFSFALLKQNQQGKHHE